MAESLEDDEMVGHDRRNRQSTSRDAHQSEVLVLFLEFGSFTFSLERLLMKRRSWALHAGHISQAVSMTMSSTLTVQMAAIAVYGPGVGVGHGRCQEKEDRKKSRE